MKTEKIKKPFYKKWWVWLIALFIFGAAATGGEEESTAPKEDVKAIETSAQANEKENKSDSDEKAKQEAAEKKKAEEEAKKKAEEEAKKNPQQEMIEKISTLFDSKQAFDTGSYVKGDIPEGEYAFIPFNGSGQYFSEEDGAGNIVDNEIFDSFGYVYVHGTGNIKADAVLIKTDAFKTLGVSSAKQIYEVINNKSNYQESAWYKVGVDIPAGQYTIESFGEGYVAIMSGPVGNNDIVDNEIFNGKYAVNVSNGQYLKVSKGKLTKN